MPTGFNSQVRNPLQLAPKKPVPAAPPVPAPLPAAPTPLPQQGGFDAMGFVNTLRNRFGAPQPQRPNIGPNAAPDPRYTQRQVAPPVFSSAHMAARTGLLESDVDPSGRGNYIPFINPAGLFGTNDFRQRVLGQIAGQQSGALPPQGGSVQTPGLQFDPTTAPGGGVITEPMPQPRPDFGLPQGGGLPPPPSDVGGQYAPGFTGGGFQPQVSGPQNPQSMQGIMELIRLLVVSKDH